MDNKFKKGDYVIVKLHGSMFQPGYISSVNQDSSSYNIELCLLSLDKKHIEKFEFENVSADLIRAA